MATASSTNLSDDSSLYTTLHQERKEIRVLTLEAGSFTEDVSAAISVVSLDDRPKYEALSYVWGDPGITQEIRLCGRPFSVTTNLAAALRRIRAPDEVRVIWVDALCINQVDIFERNSQVQLMHNVYTLASKVLVWLGEEDETTPLVMDFLKTTADGGHYMTESCIMPGFHDDTTRVNYIGALDRFLRRPYWSRIWTAQEMILAKNIEIICGHFRMAWEAMDNSMIGIMRHYQQCCTKFRPCPNCQKALSNFENLMARVQRSQRQIETGRRPSLTRLLIEQRGQNATDPRDKVYALLSLVNAEDASRVKPNYDPEFKVEDLYIETTWKDIVQTQSLSILGQALYNNPGLSLPSWVADWSSTSANGSFIPSTRQVWGTLYAAGGKLDKNIISRNGNVLMLTAILVDKVDTVGNTCFSDEPTFSRALNNWRKISGLDRDPLAEYPRGGKLKEAFWRTIISDVAIQTYTDGPNTEEVYRRAIAADGKAYFEWFTSMKAPGPIDPATRIRTWRVSVASTQGQRMFTTRNGCIGMGPAGILQGDEIYVVAGSSQPLILRIETSTEKSPDAALKNRLHHSLVGMCYVHGIMDGEYVQDQTKGPVTIYVK